MGGGHTHDVLADAKESRLDMVRRLSTSPTPATLVVTTIVLSCITLYIAKPSVTLNKDDERSYVRIGVTAIILAGCVYATIRMIQR